MKRWLAVTTMCAVALATAAYAQKKPDFSGTWLIDQAATGAASGAAAPGGANAPAAGMAGGGLVIKHDGDSFTVQPAGNTGTLSYSYKLDGAERDVKSGSVALKARARWEADKVVVDQTRTGPDGTPATTTTTYSLDKDGNLWTETTTPRGPRKIVYKKKPVEKPKVI